MYYAFESDEITRCIDCPFITDRFDCGLNRLSDMMEDMDEQFEACPLKLATGVIDVTPESIKTRQYIASIKDILYDDGER